MMILGVAHQGETGGIATQVDLAGQGKSTERTRRQVQRNPPCTLMSRLACSSSIQSNLSSATKPNRSSTPSERYLRCRKVRHKWPSRRVQSQNAKGTCSRARWTS